ncbi:MAG: hypothetical protein AAF823_07065 [Planctomycetota bacterium]
MAITPEHVAWAACAVIGYLLVHASMMVVEARARFATTRHDLVVEAKKIRAEYHASLMAQDEDAEHAEIVEDDDEDAADDSTPEPEAADQPIPMPPPADEPDASDAELKPAA